MRARSHCRKSGAARWQIVLVGVCLVLLLLAGMRAVMHGQAGGRGTAAGSSFRADETGLLATRLLLEEVGFSVESRRGARLPRGVGHVLVRLHGLPASEDAAEELPPEEVRARAEDLGAWIRRGNAIVVFASAMPESGELPEVLDDSDDDVTPTEYVDLELDSPLTSIYGLLRPKDPMQGKDREVRHQLAGLERPWVSPGWRVVPRDDDVVLAEAESGDGSFRPVLLERSAGEGKVIVVADPYFAGNVRVANSDNGAWVVTLVDRARTADESGTTVWIDDRAVGQIASRGVLSLFVEVGLGFALASLGLFLVALFWRGAASDAPNVDERAVAAYRPETFAAMRANLYADCMTAGEVRRVVRDEVARRLGRGETRAFERSIELLEMRHPEQAERLRDALARIPRDDRAALSSYPQTWCRAVTAVWRVLDDIGGRREPTGESEDDRTAES